MDQGRIRQAMNIQPFIDPDEERVGESSDEIIDSIVARHGIEREAESDEEVEETVAIQTLRSYQEQNGELDPDFGLVLKIPERVYLARRSKGMGQGHLTNWLTN